MKKYKAHKDQRRIIIAGLRQKDNQAYLDALCYAFERTKVKFSKVSGVNTYCYQCDKSKDKEAVLLEFPLLDMPSEHLPKPDEQNKVAEILENADGIILLIFLNELYRYDWILCLLRDHLPPNTPIALLCVIENKGKWNRGIFNDDALTLGFQDGEIKSLALSVNRTFLQALQNDDQFSPLFQRVQTAFEGFEIEWFPCLFMQKDWQDSKTSFEQGAFWLLSRYEHYPREDAKKKAWGRR